MLVLACGWTFTGCGIRLARLTSPGDEHVVVIPLGAAVGRQGPCRLSHCRASVLSLNCRRLRILSDMVESAVCCGVSDRQLRSFKAQMLLCGQVLQLALRPRELTREGAS